MTAGRVLVVFVDALGGELIAPARAAMPSLPHTRALGGVLGYSSGALATVLTGGHPEDHGRMCLFARAPEGGDRILAPLRLLGLLPRLVHERSRVRRLVGRVFARAAGLTGYVALHRVPPTELAWLDLPERDDLFRAQHVGGVRTFLADARAAGLAVYAAPWQLAEPERWRASFEALETRRPDLAFLYATTLDARLHEHGNRADVAGETLAAIGAKVERARAALGADGADVHTLVVGDHGMATVTRVIDPRSVTRRLRARPGLRLFVDSTMLRLWGDEAELDRARDRVLGARWPGRWLGPVELRVRRAPVLGAPYGDAVFLLREGVIFAPSYVGGAVRGMHGYDLSACSARAGLLSDRALPDELGALADVAAQVRNTLGVA